MNIKEVELKNVLNRLNNMAHLLPLVELNRLKLKKIRLEKALNINKVKNNIKKVKKSIPCPHCSKKFTTAMGMASHIKDKHSDIWLEYLNKKRILKGFIFCVYCYRAIKETNIEKHLKKCTKNKDNALEVQKCEKNIEKHCPYCNIAYQNTKSLDFHVSTQHIDKWDKYIKDEEVRKRFLNKKESRCKYCGLFLQNIDDHIKKCFKNSLNNWVLCEYCKVKLNKKNYEKHLKKCPKNKNVINQKEQPISKEKFWEAHTSIKEIEEEKTTLTNIEKHQAIKYQFREDEELDPDLIDEEAYQKTFGTQLDDKSQQIRNRVAFEHEKIYKQEEEDKSEIKIFLSKMYKGYCQVCGYTFKKTNGVNSFERFNWNDKRVVKVKKSLVSTADSLCLCRNCSANIKWGAFYPNFVDTIREIEEFKSKNYDEVKDKIHKVVDENIPKIFEPLLEFDDIYALEIELDGKARNIYFTNEHLLQFVTYLQKEDEVEEEVIEKKRVKEQRSRISSLSSGIYSSHVWLKREETIPLSVAQDFVRNSAWWLTHPSGAVRAKKHAYNVYKNDIHGWAIDFGANKFLVGKAIERCKDEINKYIEEFTNGEKSIELDSLKAKLKKHISGAVATYNNGEYSGYYPIDGNDLTFGSQAIDVKDGADFLIRELGLDDFLEV